MKGLGLGQQQLLKSHILNQYNPSADPLVDDGHYGHVSDSGGSDGGGVWWR